MSERLDLGAIKEREKAATEGPWEAGADEVTKSSDLIYDHPKYPGQPILPDDGPLEVCSCFRGTSEQRHLDAEFIAHAREDIPALLAEVAKCYEWLDRIGAAAGYGRVADVAAHQRALGVEGDHETRLQEQRVAKICALVTEACAFRDDSASSSFEASA